MVREGRVFINPGTRPAYGVGFRVAVRKPGGRVASASSGLTINLDPGHGLAVGDKFIVGLDDLRYRTVTANSDTSVDVNSAVSVARDEYVINLGTDSGATSPNYDGSGLRIFQDMGLADAYADSTVSTDSTGRYRYFHEGGQTFWELVLAGNTPVAYYLDVQHPEPTTISVKDFGARGDGTTDDTAAFQGAAAYVAAVSGPYGGARIFMPRGTYRISATVALRHGMILEGEGPGATAVSVVPGFSGSSLFKWDLSDGNVQGPGYGARDFAVAGNGVSVHAIHMIRAYDGIILDNLKIDDTGPLSNCYRIEGSESNTTSVAQSILLSNCYGIHARSSSPTAATFYFKSCQEMTLVNCKGFGCYSDGLGSGDVFYFQGCRGVTVIGGAAANSTGIGYHCYTTDRTQEGLTFLGNTCEAVGESYVCESTGGLATKNVYIYGPRIQEATVVPPTATGPIRLASTQLADVRAHSFEIKVQTNSQDVRIWTDNLSRLTENAGSRTRIEADYNSTDPQSNFFHCLGQSLVLDDDSSGGPVFRMAHRSRSPRDHWQWAWSANGGADNGFRLQYYDGTTTRICGLYVDAGGLDVHIARFGVETCKWAVPGSAESSMYLLVNDGVATTLRRVTVGAADSGGAGFRMLRVAN